ncbi:hypothetical protein [Pontibacter liquoris]|uniref:hypothetical protein n=1 Tax=Pontibacter liquoris TaxID=2905677 RepID=UPI001FA71031|nr:hypothetical protein [Pontibacter liquoris]
MAHPRKELDIDEDMTLQRRFWTFERIGWVCMFLFLLAAVLGLLGRGGIGADQEKAGSQGEGLEVAYDRFLRQDAPSKMEVTFYRPQPEQQLSLNKTFLKKARIEQIVPEPSKSEITSEGIIYTFDVKGKGAVVTFYFEPAGAGSLQTVVSDNATTLTINQFIYP